MRDFLFDTPYWFLGALVVVAVGLWLSGNARQEKRLKYAAYAALLAAAALALMSRLVETDREIVTRQTRAIVQAVEKKDAAAAQKLLHPRATFADMNKQQIADRIATAADQFGVRSVRITSLEVAPQALGGEITAALAATADLNANPYSGAGVPSTWDLTWVKTDQGWLLRDIVPKTIPTMDVGTLIGQLRSPRGLGK
jgi:hypothetical protein